MVSRAHGSFRHGSSAHSFLSNGIARAVRSVIKRSIRSQTHRASAAATLINAVAMTQSLAGGATGRQQHSMQTPLSFLPGTRLTSTMRLCASLQSRIQASLKQSGRGFR